MKDQAISANLSTVVSVRGSVMDVRFDEHLPTINNRSRPRIGRVLTARGREAADAARTTTFGVSQLESLSVWTNEVSQESENVRRPICIFMSIPYNDSWCGTAIELDQVPQLKMVG